MRHFPVADLWSSGRSAVPVVAALLMAAGCRDASAPVAPMTPNAHVIESEGRGFAQRLYAIGTSISAGTCADGNVASCQQNSWVAQIIRAMHREPVLPLIQAPGCKAPFALPLISFQRTSGESISVSDAAVVCAPNAVGVTHPTQVLAVPGAWTHEVLHQTPANRTDPFGSRLYRRLLPLNKTQVTALESVHPKFVTVELGANDILQVHSGIVIPGVTYSSFASWSAVYDQILDRVGAVTKQALLVGLVDNVSKLHSMRRGHELWADRAGFLAFNVVVSPDCNGNNNLIAVNQLVPRAIVAAFTAGSFTLSCTALSPTTPDFILSATEEAQVNNVINQMTQHIHDEATERGYAYIDLEVLFTAAKPSFSVLTMMLSTTAPYGVNVSADGVHPSSAGQALIAQAALEAIEDTYHFGFEEALSRVRSLATVSRQ